jgi:hypothetical protein
LRLTKARSIHLTTDRLIAKLSRLWKDQPERTLITNTIKALDAKYDLSKKMAREPAVAEIIQQMVGRIAIAFGTLPTVESNRILDIACGSNTSKAPSSFHINTPFGEKKIGRSTKGYTAQFEPWFCRILLELGADPVGIDFGDLEGEAFEHYRVDLGQRGALDFLSSHSFDAVQDSRLFGSPEFTTQFPNPGDRLKVAAEIRSQERRLLKAGGLVIHSDAEELVGRRHANRAGS